MTIFHGQVKRVNRSLRYSILDGSAYAAMLGLTQNFIAPFALALKATTQQIGLLTSIPSLVMALSQLSAPTLSEKAGSRKALILPVVFMHALMWLPILLVPFVIPGDKVWWLVTFVTISTVFGALANPAWGSMMADLVPERIRGRYFAARGRIASFITLIFAFIAGGVLEAIKPNVFLGFALLFGGAMVFRMVSFSFLARMYEVPPTHSQGPKERLIDMIRDIGSSNLGRFTIFVALLSLVTNIASPFFSVYLLRDLQLNYITYVILTSIGSLTGLVFITYWGKRADRAGNVMVIKIAAFLIPFVPLLWLVSKNPYYIGFAQTFSSFAWAGFNLASTNFVYDAAPSEGRTQRLALYNAMNGIAVFIGATSGGFLANHLPAFLGYNLLALFTLSGILRFIIVALFVRGIREVRHVTKIDPIHVLLPHRRRYGLVGETHSSTITHHTTQSVSTVPPIVNKSKDTIDQPSTEHKP
jgi:MFS family permease